MAYIVEDRIMETSTTTGTGSLTLAGAITAYRTFSSVCSTNDVFTYMVEAVDANGVPTGEWETGLGTYSGANTLARTIVSRSSNANAAVSFSAGTKRAMIAPIGGYQRRLGAMVRLSSALTGVDYSSSTAIPWSVASYDDLSFWSAGAPTRLTVPPGVYSVRIAYYVSLNNVTANTNMFVSLNKNGSGTFDGQLSPVCDTDNISPRLNGYTGVLPVIPTDFFDTRGIWGDTNVDIATTSWFTIEAVR